MKWSDLIDIRGSHTVLLMVPMAVVDELDRLKLNNATPPKGELARRTLARRALRVLQETLGRPGDWAELARPEMHGNGRTDRILLAF